MLPSSNPERRPETELPDLSQIVATLAADNARVTSFVHSMPHHLDRIVEAHDRGDFQLLKKETEFLFRSSLIYGHPAVSESAKGLCHELDKPDNHQGVLRGVMRLLATCNTARIHRSSATVAVPVPAQRAERTQTS